MWKALKEIIRGESDSGREVKDLDFGNSDYNVMYNIADRFNSFYIQSIDSIVLIVKFIKSIENDRLENGNGSIIWINKHGELMEFFEMVSLSRLRRLFANKGYLRRKVWMRE